MGTTLLLCSKIHLNFSGFKTYNIICIYTLKSITDLVTTNDTIDIVDHYNCLTEELFGARYENKQRIGVIMECIDGYQK